jgi:hypothetical protein
MMPPALRPSSEATCFAMLLLPNSLSRSRTVGGGEIA